MLIGDILNSCVNPSVAEAAVTSIGGDFAERLGVLSKRCNLSVGELVGRIVHRFAFGAAERDWRFVTLAMNGKDQPLLCGLKAIIDTTMRSPEMARDLAALVSEAAEDGLVWTVHPDMRIAALGVA